MRLFGVTCIFLASIGFAAVLIELRSELGFWNSVTFWLEQPRIDRARVDIESLEQAVKTFHERKGYYPGDLSDLAAPDPVDGSPALISSTLLTDPWGRDYVYYLDRRGSAFAIYSNGPKADGSLGRISNWD